MENDKTSTIKKQIEYYLSDENLKSDNFFHSKIESDKEGYIDLELIMECNKVKKAKWTIEDIINSIKESTTLELSENKKRIRRINNKPLPKLDLDLLNKKRKRDLEKEEKEPLILKITSNKETNDIWKQLQEKYIELNPNLNIKYTRFANKEGHFVVSPLNKKTKKSEITFISEFVLNEITFKVEKCSNEEVVNFYNEHGSHLEACLNSNKKKFKDQTKLNTPLTLGNILFVDVGHIKGHLRKISNELKQFEPFKKEDEMFIKDLLQYHNDKDEILNNTDYFTYGQKDPHSYSQYYYAMGKNKKMDFVLNKCFEKIMVLDKKKKKINI